MDNICTVCCTSFNNQHDVTVRSDYCPYCWGPRVVDTNYQPVPFCVLFSEWPIAVTITDKAYKVPWRWSKAGRRVLE